MGNMTDSERIKRTKKYRKIRQSMFDQIKKSGIQIPQFEDLIEDYMSMYITKELCKKDISLRGVSITSIGSQGQTVTKKNESIDSMLKINQQMLKLLDMLKITPDGIIDDEEM